MKSKISLPLIIRALNNKAYHQAATMASALLQKKPQNAELHHSLGVASLMLGHLDTALKHLSRATKLKEDATYLLNLALVQQRLYNADAAERALSKVLKLSPGHAQANNNLGNILSSRRQYTEAEALYRRAIQNNPRYVLAYKNLGFLLRETGRAEEALTVLRQAMDLAPEANEIIDELASTLESLNHYSEAAQWLRKRGQWSSLARLLRCMAEWQDLTHVETSALQALHDDAPMKPSPWELLMIPGLEPTVHRQAAKRFAESKWPTQLNQPPLFQAKPLPAERLRVGYLSCDFYNHATLHLMIGVLEAHDPAQFDIQLFDYSPSKQDSFTQRLANIGLPHHALHGLSDEAAAQKIAAEGIQILVDLKGYTTGARLGICALRPAPVIVSWLGYPGSLGHPRLADFIIGDPVVTPPTHSNHFSEVLALLPHCYQPNDGNRPIEPLASRSQAGLPNDGVVFCNFNQLLKLGPAEFDLWCRLLIEVPNSVLWLLEPAYEGARAQLLEQAQRRGLTPDRLVFAPRLPQATHLGRLQLADLALDSFPYTSHTTASDALWAGVPLITRMGSTFANRVAGSLLHAHGFADLVCEGIDAYFNKALSLAQDAEQRAMLRQRLQQAKTSSPLFDTSKFTADLQHLYHAIWQRHTEAPTDKSPLNPSQQGRI